MDKQKQIEEMEKENMSFIVIDNNTGKEADIGEIALKEDWAKGLIYCDMQGFALLEDGTLVLLDECGKYEYCPSGRFTVIHERAVVITREEYEELQVGKDFNYGYHNGETNMTAYYENIRLPEVRKETAEKFAERLKEQFIGVREYRYRDTGTAWGEPCIGGFINNKIDEICKEITEKGV